MEYDPETALMRLRRRRGSGPDGGSLVIGQLGQSLDGRIATPTGASKYINGDEALCHLHRIRAEVDAVIVGIGTGACSFPSRPRRRGPKSSAACSPRARRTVPAGRKSPPARAQGAASR